MNTDSSRADLNLQMLDQLQEAGFIVLSETGNILHSSLGVARCLGYASSELVGKNTASLFLPDRTSQAGGSHFSLLQGNEEGSGWKSSWLLHQDGSQVLLKYVLFPLGGAHPVYPDAAFGLLLQDPLDDGEQSQTLKAIVNALEQSTVLVRTFEGQITHWTTGCERLYGFDRTAALGRICKELLQATLPVPMGTINLELLLNGSWSGEVEHVRRDGTHINVSTNYMLVRDAEGKPASVIETITDITGRVEAQRQLEVAHEQLKSMALELERSNEELEEFARIASHDLTAPLVSARWLTDLLRSRQKDKLDNEAQDYLYQISVSLGHMTTLVNAVLKHAEVGTSAVTASEAIALSQAVDTAVQDLRQQIDLAQATIVCGPLPKLRIEHNALDRLLQNLLSNAIKYRSAQRPLIEITASWDEPQWTISFKDNGVGIDPSWHEHIFKPMQRLHGKEIDGSGIGLATCRKIVARAGGRIWVESEPGVGSTFRFTLPGEAPI